MRVRDYTSRDMRIRMRWLTLDRQQLNIRWEKRSDDQTRPSIPHCAWLVSTIQGYGGNTLHIRTQKRSFEYILMNGNEIFDLVFGCFKILLKKIKSLRNTSD